MNRHVKFPQRAPMRDRQRGTMLIISLIVLVAMTLAGIAMMRSTDTASLVAGNVGFRQSTVNAADQGLQAGYAWLNTQLTAGALFNSIPSAGYAASPPSAGDPDWTQNATWNDSNRPAFYLNGGAPDSGGNVVAYLIDRMCLCDGNTNGTCTGLGGVQNSCGTTPNNIAVSGVGVDQSQPNFFTLPPATHYRITSRVVGPRGAVAIVQAMLRIQ